MRKETKLEKPIEEYDASSKVTVSEAKEVLKEMGGKVPNKGIDAFVKLQSINKVYPNGVQAVYDFNLDINQHEFIVFVGPSGCGKSTTLSMVAGLNDITSGYLYIDKILSNYLPAKDRDISMVFQSYALYPQMTVYDNIAFPLKVRKYHKPLYDWTALSCREVISLLGERKGELDSANKEYEALENKPKKDDYLASVFKIQRRSAKILSNVKDSDNIAEIISKNQALLQAQEEKASAKGHKIIEDGRVLDENGEQVIVYRKLTKEEIRDKVFWAARMLDLGNYLDRRPKELSGGQMQRVALGRAIVRDAKLFLMDEPLSNLDAKLRVAMRSEIVSLHEKIGATTIYVTHDQTEAMTMATRIVVMSKGWVQQVGTPQEVYRKPKNLFVATFIGSPAMNIYDGHYENGYVAFKDGYKIKLEDDFVKKHDEFYKGKIDECKHMLSLCDTSVEDKAKAVFGEIKGTATKEEAVVKAEELVKVLEGLNKPISGPRNLDAAKQYLTILKEDGKDSKDAKHAYEVLRRCLDDVETISYADVVKIHSAQAFSSNTKEKDTTEVITYEKPKKDNFITRFKDKRKQKKALKNVRVRIDDPVGYVNGLLEKYEAALKGGHDVKIGIRPEHIHLAEEHFSEHKSEAFDFNTGIIELLGNELLVHGEWNEVDTIAKISTGTLVKSHSSVKVSIDSDKIHVFDISSGETITA